MEMRPDWHPEQRWDESEHPRDEHGQFTDAGGDAGGSDSTSGNIDWEEVSPKNAAAYEGKPFWSGAYDVIDGKILETHTYEEASYVDFHHSLYFSEKISRKMGAGEVQFFWVESNHVIQTDWTAGPASPEIIQAIKNQLEFRPIKSANKADLLLAASRMGIAPGKVNFSHKLEWINIDGKLALSQARRDPNSGKLTLFLDALDGDPITIVNDCIAKGVIARQIDQTNTLYVHRPLLNADDIIEWAKAQGFATTLPADDMHVTIAFSKSKVDWSNLVAKRNIITVDGGRREVKRLGENGEAVVLAFSSSELSSRWKEFIDEGASWDFPSYQPHMTITWHGADIDLNQVRPYDGSLKFGPEVFAELDEDWKDKITEREWDENEHPRDEDGKFTDAGGGDDTGGDVEGSSTIDIKSPAFKEWFGNSKITTQSGVAKVMYHGTEADIQSPKTSMGDDRGMNLFPSAIFFTDDRDYAKEYGPNIIECYLKIERPYIIDPDNKPEQAKQRFEFLEQYDDPVEILQKKGFDGAVFMQAGGMHEVAVFSESQLRLRHKTNKKLLREWDESEHPRDEEGKFTDAGGGDGEDEGGIDAYSDLSTDLPTKLSRESIIAEANNHEANSRGVPVVAREVNARASAILKQSLGVKSITSSDPKTDKFLVSTIAKELKDGIKKFGEQKHWYGDDIKKTMKIASAMYPEIAKDKDKQFIFKVAMAVSSQGGQVNGSASMTVRAYEHFQKTGKFPLIGFRAQGNFKKMNALIGKFGVKGTREFFDKQFSAKELADKTGIKIYRTNVSDIVYGSAVLGPKIGQGFYQNLNGNFKPITMDRWFMRMWGRITATGIGTVDMQKVSDRLRNALKAEGKPVPKTDERLADVARTINAAYEDDYKKNREQYDSGKKEKTELIYAAERFVHNKDNGMVEEPGSAANRHWIENIFERGVKESGTGLDNAAAQAVMWTPEQDLYKKLGALVPEVGNSYAKAFAKIASAKGVKVNV